MIKHRLFSTVCLAVLLAFAAHAQLATTTSLVGTVTDSSGNKVPYYVVFVEEAFRGTAYAQLRVYLDRFQPAQWPSYGV